MDSRTTQRFDRIDQLLDEIERGIDLRFEERLEGKIDLIAEGYRDIDRRLGEFRAWTETAIGTLDRRVMRLES